MSYRVSNDRVLQCAVCIVLYDLVVDCIGLHCIVVSCIICVCLALHYIVMILYSIVLSCHILSRIVSD